MIEPLNPDVDNLIDFNFQWINHEWLDDVWDQVKDLDENDTVTLQWRNMEIRTRVGTARAWLELSRMA